ncbi:hypothetical protein E4H12_05320 [Candidatus Thorarchaeota archaeon]|nr:MAG: hypothetical protein E4H12_05320 [Candidatus Thorarchaeota archaeon]
MKEEHKELLISGSVMLAIVAILTALFVWPGIVGPILLGLVGIVVLVGAWAMIHSMLFDDHRGY